MQFGIFVIVEVQEINFRGSLLGSKCDGDYHYNITSLFNKSLQICYKKRLKNFFLKFPKE